MIANKIKKLRNKDQGFTIIEILIVLAIAGLILLIVFLAVPALQRNQRNSGRKSDAGHISTAINDYISNNNGVFPVNGNAANANPPQWDDGTVCTSILSDAGTLSQFNTTKDPLTCANGTDMAHGNFNLVNSPASLATPNVTKAVPDAAGDYDALLVVEDATCGSNYGTTVQVNTGTLSQAVLVYTLESGSTTDYNQACLSIE